jgi:hypothetical protein
MHQPTPPPSRVPSHHQETRMATFYQLDFEKPVAEIEDRIAKAEKSGGRAEVPALPGIDTGAEDPNRTDLDALRKERDALLTKLYTKLSPWNTVRVARHPDRPQSRDYINRICRDFCELHGDRRYGDDPAIVTGFARIGSQGPRRRPPEGPEHPRETLLPLRLRPPRGLPQGPGQDGTRREVRRPHRHPRRHPRGLPRPRCRATRGRPRPSPSTCAR